VANPLQRHAVVQRATPALCVTMEMRGPPGRRGTGQRAMRRVGGVEAPGSATNRRVATRSDAAPSLKGRAGALCLNEDEGLPRRRRSGRRSVRGWGEHRMDLPRSMKWRREVGLGLGGAGWAMVHGFR
jgi:hypothetical protein